MIFVLMSCLPLFLKVDEFNHFTLTCLVSFHTAKALNEVGFSLPNKIVVIIVMIIVG
jgi:hypothetical protein